MNSQKTKFLNLKLWQVVILSTPIIILVGFFLITAGIQIKTWGINWIWAIFIVILAAWRWLLVKWTKPTQEKLPDFQEIITPSVEIPDNEKTQKIEQSLKGILTSSRNDPPLWEDSQMFWKRCQEVIVTVANTYHPEVKYPLLNIYIPQAYSLIRGTVDDLDRWMQQLSPVLGKVTVGQAYQGYEMYQKLEPSARKLWQVWNWAQWFINPAAAAAKLASQPSNEKANQQLLGNLNQMLREAALRNLCAQAVTLYSGDSLPDSIFKGSSQTLAKAKTQTLREIIQDAEPAENLQQKPVNLLLVGRTGAGKSSLINTLFQADCAEVDVLPSTDRIQNYHWTTPTGESLTLWDSPGYEQVNREDLRDIVLDYAYTADALLLVTPALDPALQMDVDFLEDLKGEIPELPAIAIITQVDRLRPVREWQPPYHWETGTKPKEKSIREATQYRSESLQNYCEWVLPIVTQDQKTNRRPWNADTLSKTLIDILEPTKQSRLARFLRNQETRIHTAAKIIDRYTFQMSTTQGLTALLKSPVLQFISTLTTGQPTLAYLLAEQIPIEELPVVIGKLQMAYDLFSLLSEQTNFKKFDLLALWPLLLENSDSPDRNAWAFGHALVEYWTQNLSINQFKQKYEQYLQISDGESPRDLSEG